MSSFNVTDVIEKSDLWKFVRETRRSGSTTANGVQNKVARWL